MLDDLIRVRCKGADKVAMQAAAQDEGLSLSEWLRRAGVAAVEAKFGTLLKVGADVKPNGDGGDAGNFQW